MNTRSAAPPSAGAVIYAARLAAQPLSMAAMRRLAELAVQAAVQAEEEAAWHARQRATTALTEGAQGA